MYIAIGSDHAGFKRKQNVRDILLKWGHKVVDVGCHNENPCDYPDYAKRVGSAVSKGRCNKGILICGTGIGMSIAANKIHGVRAAACWSRYTARMAAEHNWTNVLCLPARVLNDLEVARILREWLESKPEGGRHKRRVRKIEKIEVQACL